jgi:2-dehydropantoate 2-reductase
MENKLNILIIGLGVIGTTYGYVFSKAGPTVEHYIRKTSKNYNIEKLNVEILDGRFESKGKQSSDTYIVNKASKKVYDFIFVAIPSGNIQSVIEVLDNEEIKGTIILACGIWENHDYVNNLMAKKDYILGYPVAGGNIDNGTLNCCVFDHFMLESKEKSNISNYDELLGLFSSSNVTLEHPYDMLEWIWLHMAINAGVVSVAGKYGDINNVSESAEKLMNSTKKLSEAVKSIRETSKIVESRGVTLKRYNNELIAYKLPTIISSPIMKRMFATNILTRKIMTLHSNLQDLLFVCRCVYDEGKQNGVSAPIFYKNYDIVKSNFCEN